MGLLCGGECETRVRRYQLKFLNSSAIVEEDNEETNARRMFQSDIDKIRKLVAS